jgi:hypothetical protein
VFAVFTALCHGEASICLQLSMIRANVYTELWMADSGELCDRYGVFIDVERGEWRGGKCNQCVEQQKSMRDRMRIPRARIHLLHLERPVAQNAETLFSLLLYHEILSNKV